MAGVNDRLQYTQGVDADDWALEAARKNARIRQSDVDIKEKEYADAVTEQNSANSAYQNSLQGLIKQYAPAETEEQRLAREKSDRAKRNIALASEIVKGVGNMFTAGGRGGRAVRTDNMVEAVDKGIAAREAREKQRRTDYSNLVTNYQRARKEAADARATNAYNAYRQAQQNQLYYDRIAASAEENDKRRAANSEEKEKDRIARAENNAARVGASLSNSGSKLTFQQEKDAKDRRDKQKKDANDAYDDEMKRINSKYKDKRGTSAKTDRDMEEKAAKDARDRAIAAAEDEYSKTMGGSSSSRSRNFKTAGSDDSMNI